MSGEAAQMNQVGGSGVDGADRLPQHQQMQDAEGIDQQFLMLRYTMRAKIFEYIERRSSAADWRPRLPELARRLEETLFRKFPDKNEYYNMMKGPIEPQLQYAIKTLSAQNQLNQQNQQISRQTAFSSGYGTTVPTPGIMQGASGNSSLPYVTDNTGLSSSGAGMALQNASMGTSLPGSVSNGYQHLSTSVPLNYTTNNVASTMGVAGIQQQMAHMNMGQTVHLFGQMSGQAAQMNQDGSSGVVGADGLPQHQQMQDTLGLVGLDQQFVMLRSTMRDKISEYIGRRSSVADWQRRVPELAKRLEETLFRKFSNKNDYHDMMKGPLEPQLQYAIKNLSALNQPNQQI